AFAPLASGPLVYRVMQLIRGVGNGEMIGWTIFSVFACFLVAFPLSYFFRLDDIHWRVAKGGKYEDYEKFIEMRNLALRDVFDRLHRDVTDGRGKADDDEVTLPYFTPEVYCPHLVPAGGRQLCAPWMFDSPVLLNYVDAERLKETKQRVILRKKEKGDYKKGHFEKGGFEASGCCAYSLHTALEQSDEDREWKGALSGCDFKTFDGVNIEPIAAADMKAGGVCQLVMDMTSNIADTVKSLRKFGEQGYRIMSYEKIESNTARFSFIQSNCTDHFGAKYIKKYLV
ncbi:hypothetical protein PRIPAC_78907, partial [Pristionchus pacificus]|uniref:Uncharacterized protein n=1 Tax=Pristionchus pacificus TaxID=54126 RepID=A0A2A6BVZ8_PRIPA